MRSKPFATASTGDLKEPARILWTGPLLSPSGYGEESRNLLFALHAAGVRVAGQILPWPGRELDLGDAERGLLNALAQRPVRRGFVHIVHDFAPRIGRWRHPEASVVIGRTMFETDRLPADWVAACNELDAVWVASAFNRETFVRSGVDARLIAVVPGCFDTGAYSPRIRSGGGEDRPVSFLSVFDWTLHKGWDTLIRAYARAFAGRSDVRLVLKVWSSLGYTPQQMLEQVAARGRQWPGVDLEGNPPIGFRTQFVGREGLAELYREADVFVLPSRGEGWGRPYTEAMLSGVPAVGTGWGGNTEFMTGENSWLLPFRLVPVPEEGWKEVPVYRGHRWAEPDEAALIEVLLNLAEDPAKARAKAETGRSELCRRYSREAIGAGMSRLLKEARGGEAI